MLKASNQSVRNKQTVLLPSLITKPAIDKAQKHFFSSRLKVHPSPNVEHHPSLHPSDPLCTFVHRTQLMGKRRGQKERERQREREREREKGEERKRDTENAQKR